MSGQPFITLENITVRVGRRWLLPGTNWQIGQGQNWIVTGANGAGKSTLARVLMGEVAVVKGRVRRHYEADAHRFPDRAPLAMISSEQYHQLFRQEQWVAQMRHFSGRTEEQTPAGDILKHAAMGKKNLNEIPGWQALCAAFDLVDILEKPLIALSSGETRKLLIARALVQQPRLLILDEPFNGLDAASRDRFEHLLAQWVDSGTQLVLIVHRLGEVPAYCTHRLELDHGRIVHQAGQTVMRSPDASSRIRPINANPRAASAPHATVLIQMQGVTVRYGLQVVLDAIDWTVQTGEHWALIGPNGAGKSTLLKLITGDHLQAYANKIDLFGRPKGSGESIWEIRQRIGYLGDDFQARYQRHMTAFDVVCSGFFDSVGLYRHCTAAQMETARRWCRTLALEELAGHPMLQLSFGQQRLILIARAVVKTPQLLILDEPCNGLDAGHRRSVLQMLDRIAGNGHTHLLYVSHQPADMPTCITHRLYLENGRIVGP